MLNKDKWDRFGDSLRLRDGIEVLAYDPNRDDDFVLREFFSSMAEDGTVSRVFSENIVSTADDFVRFFQSPNIMPIFLVVDETISGMGWLTNVVNHSGMPHFSFLSNVWGRRTIDMGHRLLEYWFSVPGEDDRDVAIDILVGMTPGLNKLACKFVRRLGFTVIGEIPRIASGGPMMVSYIENETHRGRV